MCDHRPIGPLLTPGGVSRAMTLTSLGSVEYILMEVFGYVGYGYHLSSFRTVLPKGLIYISTTRRSRESYVACSNLIAQDPSSLCSMSVLPGKSITLWAKTIGPRAFVQKARQLRSYDPEAMLNYSLSLLHVCEGETPARPARPFSCPGGDMANMGMGGRFGGRSSAPRSPCAVCRWYLGMTVVPRGWRLTVLQLAACGREGEKERRKNGACSWEDINFLVLVIGQPRGAPNQSSVCCD